MMQISNTVTDRESGIPEQLFTFKVGINTLNAERLINVGEYVSRITTNNADSVEGSVIGANRTVSR